MGNFNRDRGGRSGGGRFTGGGRDYNDRSSDRDRPTLHKTICSKCGKECEVPFKPTGSKPVFCRDCFREQGGAEPRRSEGGNFNRPSFDNRNEQRGSSTPAPQYKEQFEALNQKLDKILKLLNPVTPTQNISVQKEKTGNEVEVIAPKEIVVLEKKKRAPKTPKKEAIPTAEQPQE